MRRYYMIENDTEDRYDTLEKVRRHVMMHKGSKDFDLYDGVVSSCSKKARWQAAATSAQRVAKSSSKEIKPSPTSRAKALHQASLAMPICGPTLHVRCDIGVIVTAK